MPVASQFVTPCSKPIPAERILTPVDVTTLFLRSLLQSTEAFLGNLVDGAVFTDGTLIGDDRVRPLLCPTIFIFSSTSTIWANDEP
jgi:hypothetical protein